LNGAESRLQLVLGQGDDILWAQDLQSRNRAVVTLPQTLDHCFELSGITPADLGGIACVRGPGTFTGLRVVISLAMGLGLGSNIPLAGLDYLPLLAGSPCLPQAGEIWVCTFARRGMVYLQGFSPDRAPLGPPEALMEPEAQARLQGRSRSLCLVGTGLRLNPGHWQDKLPRAVLAHPMCDHPHPHVLLEQAQAATYAHEPIEPLYLRVSDAEANLAAIAAKRGLSLEEARKALEDDGEDD
jgi:tRNA threonylcarbamoyl adenosine modification protein YeaZ